MVVGGKYYIGPAGWSYPDWEGIVYPRGGGVDRLMIIAGQMNCIEINNTFYRIPSIKMTTSWAERTSRFDNFLFTAKAWKKFTHDGDFNERDALEFMDSLSPLKEKNLLGAVLFQFPWSFRFDRAGVQHIRRINSYFKGISTAVEVRHGSWNRKEAVEFLKEMKMAFCNIDQPVIGDSIPPTSVVTREDFSYIRLHGRNRAEWFNEKAGRDERYNYLYSIDELKDWCKRASEIASKVERVFIITNNHFRGQAIVNAYQIRFLLERRKQAVPGSLLERYPSLKEIALEREPQGELEL